MNERSGAPDGAARSTGAGAGLVPDDVCLSAVLCQEALAPLLDADWDRPASGLEWPCRRTLQHVANALDWLRSWMEFPSEARGLFTSGGSMANFNAIVCARERHLGAEIRRGTHPGD